MFQYTYDICVKKHTRKKIREVKLQKGATHVWGKEEIHPMSSQWGIEG